MLVNLNKIQVLFLTSILVSYELKLEILIQEH